MCPYYVRRRPLVDRHQSSDIERPAGFGYQDRPTGYAPPTDVCEAATEFRIHMEVARIDPDQVEVIVAEDRQHVTVAGDRRPPESCGECRYVNLEVQYGPFMRAIRLPTPVDGERSRATYRDGLLTVTLPKAMPAGNKRRVHIETQ